MNKLFGTQAVHESPWVASRVEWCKLLLIGKQRSRTYTEDDASRQWQWVNDATRSRTPEYSSI